MGKYNFYPEFFSLEETSQLSELHEATIRRLIQNDRLNPAIPTRPYRFNLNNLITCRIFHLLNQHLTWKQIDKAFTPNVKIIEDDQDLFNFDGYDIIVTDTNMTIYFDLNDFDRTHLEKNNDKNCELFIGNNICVDAFKNNIPLIFKKAYFIYLDRIRKNLENKAKELNIDNLDEKLKLAS